MGARRRGTAEQKQARRSDPWDRLLGWLALGPRSEREVLTRLRHWRVEPDQAEALVQRLQAAGLIDDAAYASSLARELAAKGHWTPAIVSRLRARGIGPELAATVAAEAAASDDADGRAIGLARRRIRSLPPGEAGARRLIAYLRRRGYGDATARAAAARVLGDDREDVDD